MKNKLILYFLKLIKKDCVMNQKYKFASYLRDIEKHYEGK